MLASRSSTNFTPDDLIVNSDDVIMRKITVLAGQNLVRGAVLGKVSASGKYVLSAAAAGDGSQAPDCILVDATDATGGDKEAIGIFKASVLESKLTLGAGHTLDSIREGLRVKSIHLLKSIAN